MISFTVQCEFVRKRSSCIVTDFDYIVSASAMIVSVPLTLRATVTNKCSGIRTFSDHRSRPTSVILLDVRPRTASITISIPHFSPASNARIPNYQTQRKQFQC